MIYTWVSNINPVTWTKLLSLYPLDWPFQTPLNPDITSTNQARPHDFTYQTWDCIQARLKQLNIKAKQLPALPANCAAVFRSEKHAAADNATHLFDYITYKRSEVTLSWCTNLDFLSLLQKRMNWKRRRDWHQDRTAENCIYLK